jgi:hypothetical protein
MFLAPGTYALSAHAGGTDVPAPEGFSWQITCANGPNGLLLDQQMALAGPAVRTVRSEFRVPPSGCSAQWLALQIASGDQPGGTEAWVASVRIHLADRGG